jgi:hypothetical protein
MKNRKLGQSGVEASAIALGCMSIGIAEVYTSSLQSESDAIALVRRAVDLMLTSDNLERLERAAPKGAVSGDRYEPGMMQLNNG